MNRTGVEELLTAVKAGEVSIDRALDRLRKLPFEAVGEMGKLDHHRELRSGVPEVVFGESKTAQAIADLLGRLAENRGSALATRVDADKADIVVARVPRAEYRADARAVFVPPESPREPEGRVAVLSAGTSDAPVVNEVAVTLEHLDVEPLVIMDVGVAGLPRTVAAAEKLSDVQAVVIVAGMEGALPGVIAGLTERPIIAVPTSVGYGVGLGGYVAMMAMLATCSPGVSVVNIDNGFGAAVAAARIARVGRTRE